MIDFVEDRDPLETAPGQMVDALNVLTRRYTTLSLRHTALLAALDALVTQWQETFAHVHRRARTLDHVPASQSYDYGRDQAFAQCADALVAVVAMHREAR
jgi:hypothetical protein